MLALELYPFWLGSVQPKIVGVQLLSSVLAPEFAFIIVLYIAVKPEPVLDSVEVYVSVNVLVSVQPKTLTTHEPSSVLAFEL